MADIVLINPRFEVSFWGLEHAMPFLGKRAVFPVAALPLLAALTPAPHKITLIDENVGDIDFDRCAAADIVGLTGMSVQRVRMREILVELKRRGAYVVIGGPWVTLQEDYFGDLADAIFVGEAEDTWPQFLTDWAENKPLRRYEQSERTDMSRVPAPRFDLLPMKHYAFSSVQFSRGCPFTCEFCDIIVTFGRRPRLKTSAQIIAEIEALYALGSEFVFIVDDNLIGNKKAIRPILRDLQAWQERHGFPLTLFTEASLDLADDPDMLTQFSDVNIVSVFVGIESPNEAALIEAKKKQNLRGECSLVEKVHIIQRAGIEVWSGMILGFDNDDTTSFDAHLAFLREARIIHSMTGMLTALPKTPLYDRLMKAGRVDTDDISAFGTNVVPLRMSRQDLLDGYIRLMQQLYTPAAYFDRFEDLFVTENLSFGRGRQRYWSTHPWQRMQAGAMSLMKATAILVRVVRTAKGGLKAEYLRRIARMMHAGLCPEAWLVFALKCAIHVHVNELTMAMQQRDKPVRNTF